MIFLLLINLPDHHPKWAKVTNEWVVLVVHLQRSRGPKFQHCMVAVNVAEKTQ